MAQLPPELEGLLRTDAYPHAVRSVELVETHISWVLLTGEFAYKIKRPVCYPFVDLRSAERRAFFCAEEVRLNRRFAPELYLDVCDIRADDAGAHIGGAGTQLERCVKMRQFPRDQELDRLLAEARIEPEELERFGADIADIHERLPVADARGTGGPADARDTGGLQNQEGGQETGTAQDPADAQGPHGTQHSYPAQRPGGIRLAMLENLDEYAEAAASLGRRLDPALRGRFEARLDAVASAMDVRRTRGRVRECHGDLHARNVVRRDSRLVAFDCMEFEPAFRWIDVAQEIALLIADLQARGSPRHAHAFLTGYLAKSGDFHACRVLDLYEADRAMVRAKVAAIEAANATGDNKKAAAGALHDAYVQIATRGLSRRTPRLILMSGQSGSGKTWLAQRLAPDLDAIHIRSDIERKRLAGLDETASSKSGVAAGLYGAEQTRAVYEHMVVAAESALAGGFATIVDATFSSREQRALFAKLAQRMGVRISVVLCEAPVELLRERIAQRQQAGRDASEADLAVLAWQRAHWEPVQPDESLQVIRLSTARVDAPEVTLRTLGSENQL